jgi:phage terminase small subunit
MPPKPAMSRQAITDKALATQELFAAAYVANGRNGTAAAKTAGLSAKTAASAATRMLKMPFVVQRVAVLQQQALDASAFKAEDVMKQLAALVRFDPRKMFREDGTLKDVHELDDDTAAAMAAFEVTEETVGGARGKKGDGRIFEYTKKVKWYDKNVAIANAMKHFKLLGPDGGTTVNVGIVMMPSEFKQFL